MRRPFQRISTAVCAGLLGAALASPALSRAQIPSPRPEHSRPEPRPPAAPPQLIGQTLEDSFPALQRRLADAIKRGDLAGAVTVAERQHRLYPNEMKATADLGDALLARGDTARAEPLLRAAITQPSKLYASSIAPVLGGIYANLGQIALAKGQPRDAISSLQRAVDYAPTSARPRFLLATAFAVAGDVDRSSREIRAAFDIDSTAARPGDYLLLARSLRSGKNLADSNKAVDAGLRRFPADLDLREERAEVLLARDEPADALGELLYAQMLVRENDERADRIAKRIDDIRRMADAATSDSDGPTTLDALASFLDDAETGQFDEALPTILAVVDAKPTGVVERLLLARAFVGTGRMGEAEQLLGDILSEDPANLPALVDLAWLYYAEGRSTAAEATIARARVLDAQNARLRQVVAAWSGQ